MIRARMPLPPVKRWSSGEQAERPRSHENNRRMGAGDGALSIGPKWLNGDDNVIAEATIGAALWGVIAPACRLFTHLCPHGGRKYETEKTPPYAEGLRRSCSFLDTDCAGESQGRMEKDVTRRTALVSRVQVVYRPITVPVKHLPAISTARKRVLTCPSVRYSSPTR